MYVRRTQSIALSQVPAALQQSLAKHAEERQLLLQRVRCWLTHSDNPPATGLMGKLFNKRANSADPDPWHLTLVVLHPTHILVSTHGENRGTATLSAPHMQLSLQEASGKMAQMGGPGFSLTGFAGPMVGQPASYFVGLGPEADAQSCLHAVKGALMKAKSGTS